MRYCTALRFNHCVTLGKITLRKSPRFRFINIENRFMSGKALSSTKTTKNISSSRVTGVASVDEHNLRTQAWVKNRKPSSGLMHAIAQWCKSIVFSRPVGLEEEVETLTDADAALSGGKSIATPLVLMLTLVILVIGLIFATFTLRTDYQARSSQNILQLDAVMDIAQSLAAEAVMSKDSRQAATVIESINKITPLSYARIARLDGEAIGEFRRVNGVAYAKIIADGDEQYLSESLFVSGKRVGELVVIPDSSQVPWIAKSIIPKLAIILLLSLAAFFLLCAAAGQRFIRIPLLQLAKNLRQTGGAGQQLSISHLKGHKDNELGSIVRSANVLVGHLNNRQKVVEQREHELAVILDANPHPLFAINEARNIIFCNDATSEFFSIESEDLEGKTVSDLLGERRDKECLELYNEVDLVFTSKDTRTIPNMSWTDARSQERIVQLTLTYFALYDHPSVLISSTDITDRVKAEARVEKLAYFDDLTDLPNRNNVNDKLAEDIAYAREKSLYGAAVFIDLDEFKRINDSRGHSIGDELLRLTAMRIGKNIRQSETLARLGGDEFILSVPELSADAEDARKKASDLAARLLTLIKQPVSLNGEEFIVSASIGIALYHDEETVEELLQQADTAMYQAKRKGRDHFQIFEPYMAEENRRLVELENEIRSAIANEDFTFYLQPLFNASDVSLASGEALIRWEHPDRGLIMPGEFIEFLETSSMINPVGDFILEKVCQFICVHSKTLPQGTRIAVNIAAKQFHNANFVSAVEALLQKYHLSGSRLEFEITESTALVNIEDAIAKMKHLRTLGISFSLDDFGTGYSSLSYLKRLPVDKIKIDRSFIRDLHTDKKDMALVSSIINIANSMNLQVVAEGVETQEQVDWLAEFDDVILQGFHFSRPIKQPDFAARYLH